MKKVLMSAIMSLSLGSSVHLLAYDSKNVIDMITNKIRNAYKPPITKNIGFSSRDLYVEAYSSVDQDHQIYDYYFTAPYDPTKFMFDYDWAEISYSFYGNDYNENEEHNYYRKLRVQVGGLKNTDEVTAWFAKKYGYWRRNELWYGAFVDVTRTHYGYHFYFKVYVKVDGSAWNTWYAQCSAWLAIHSITFKVE